MNQGVSYKQFYDWYCKLHKKIVPVQIEGLPRDESLVTEKFQHKLRGIAKKEYC